MVVRRWTFLLLMGVWGFLSCGIWAFAMGTKTWTDVRRVWFCGRRCACTCHAVTGFSAAGSCANIWRTDGHGGRGVNIIGGGDVSAVGGGVTFDGNDDRIVQNAPSMERHSRRIFAPVRFSHAFLSLYLTAHHTTLHYLFAPATCTPLHLSIPAHHTHHSRLPAPHLRVHYLRTARLAHRNGLGEEYVADSEHVRWAVWVVAAGRNGRGVGRVDDVDVIGLIRGRRAIASSLCAYGVSVRKKERLYQRCASLEISTVQRAVAAHQGASGNSRLARRTSRTHGGALAPYRAKARRIAHQKKKTKEDENDIWRRLEGRK